MVAAMGRMRCDCAPSTSYHLLARGRGAGCIRAGAPATSKVRTLAEHNGIGGHVEANNKQRLGRGNAKALLALANGKGT